MRYKKVLVEMKIFMFKDGILLFPADVSWSERLLCLTSNFIVTPGRTAKHSGCFTPSVWERSDLEMMLNIRFNKPIMAETFSRLCLVHRLASCNQVLESVCSPNKTPAFITHVLTGH